VLNKFGPKVKEVWKKPGWSSKGPVVLFRKENPGESILWANNLLRNNTEKKRRKPSAVRKKENKGEEVVIRAMSRKKWKTRELPETQRGHSKSSKNKNGCEKRETGPRATATKIRPVMPKNGKKKAKKEGKGGESKGATKTDLRAKSFFGLEPRGVGNQEAITDFLRRQKKTGALQKEKKKPRVVLTKT